MEKETDTKKIDSICGDFGFTVWWEEISEHYAKCKVFEITAKGDTNYYEKIGSTGSSDTTLDIEEAQPYLIATIKWDSCSHFDFGEGGYLHLCGVDAFKDHIKLLEFLYKRAFELMGRNPEPDEEWE